MAQDKVNSTGSFYSWGNSGQPSGMRAAGFFDGPSDDVPGFPSTPAGPGCGLAYFMTGTQLSNCQTWGGPSFSFAPTGPLQFLAGGNIQTPVPFTLTPAPACSTNRSVALELVVTGFNGSPGGAGPADEFGYYTGSTASPVRTPLFNASSSSSRAAVFNPGGEYGFYLKNGAGQVFLSGDSTNGNFVLFAKEPSAPNNSFPLLTKYMVGSEDRTVPPGPMGTPGKLPNGTDADYNDVVVSVNVQPCSPMGCVLTQGGYKNNFVSKVVPVTIAGVTYSTAEIAAIFGEPVKGNGLISLAHQLITAKLNIFYNYFDITLAPADVQKAIKDAETLIAGLGAGVKIPPVGSGYLKPSDTAGITQVLDAFNSGLNPLGPKHCN